MFIHIALVERGQILFSYLSCIVVVKLDVQKVVGVFPLQVDDLFSI